MKRAQHKKSATRNKRNMKKMRKSCNMKAVQQGKHATRNECITKKVLLENSAK